MNLFIYLFLMSPNQEWITVRMCFCQTPAIGHSTRVTGWNVWLWSLEEVRDDPALSSGLHCYESMNYARFVGIFQAWKSKSLRKKPTCDSPQENNLLVYAKETRLICINSVWQNIFLVACQSFGTGYIANFKKWYELIQNIQTTEKPSHGSEIYMMSIISLFSVPLGEFRNLALEKV